ncbi:MAG: ABC transporter substrate-binding protein, partial [Mesorhizobium sp.]
PQAERKYLKQAVELFAKAGWVIKGGKMVNAKTGAPFKFEILGWNDTDQVIASPWIANLRKIGVDATLRIIDQTQYVNRVNNFDYDVIIGQLGQSESPGNEQRDFWSSKAADKPGSRNYAGIKDPVVDALVDRIIFATDRDDLVAATHALDRVLLWNFYVVPQYYRAVLWLAYWNKFGIPQKQPTYSGADQSSWWINPEKEKALAAKYKGSN